MAHGTPLDGADDIGSPGAFMLDAGISSTRHIARFWDLTPTGGEIGTAIPVRDRQEPQPKPQAGPRLYAQPGATASGVGKVIEDALRAAGLMR